MRTASSSPWTTRTWRSSRQSTKTASHATCTLHSESTPASQTSPMVSISVADSRSASYKKLPIHHIFAHTHTRLYITSASIQNNFQKVSLALVHCRSFKTHNYPGSVHEEAQESDFRRPQTPFLSPLGAQRQLASDQRYSGANGSCLIGSTKPGCFYFRVSTKTRALLFTSFRQNTGGFVEVCYQTQKGASA
jgi:hypothetical protein